MIEHDEIYKPEKLVWTTDDFEEMGWHDCQIHGVAFDGANFKIIFDIDYIYQWVAPALGTEYFSFWVSPCTLVFENAYDVRFDIGYLGAYARINILELARNNEATPRNTDFIKKKQEWTWTLDCDAGEISFKSVGFIMHTRKEPQHIPSQSFTLLERGGVKFDLT